MSRTFKSVIAAFALVVCIGTVAQAGEYCSGQNFLNEVQAYFSSSDPLPGAVPAMPQESVKTESERYVTLGDLDLSTVRNVLRHTAPVPSGLPSNDDPAPVAAPAPVTYVEYAPAPVVTYVEPAPAKVVTYAAPVTYSAPVVVSRPAALVSTSTNTNCASCQKNRR